MARSRRSAGPRSPSAWKPSSSAVTATPTSASPTAPSSSWRSTRRASRGWCRARRWLEASRRPGHHARRSARPSHRDGASAYLDPAARPGGGEGRPVHPRRDRMAVRPVLERDRDPADRRGPRRQDLGARSQAARWRDDAGVQERRIPELDQRRGQGFPPNHAAGILSAHRRSGALRAARVGSLGRRQCRHADARQQTGRQSGSAAQDGAAQPRLPHALCAARTQQARLDHDLRPRRFHPHRGRQGRGAGRLQARQASELQGRVRARPPGVRRFSDMPAAVKSALLRSPFLWMGVALLLALIGALVFSDGVAELARFSSDYQRRIQQSLSTSLSDIKAGSGSLALWTLVAVCFGYGVVHTLGPGHGKAVVVAYFLDSTRPRAWIEGILAGSWIAFTHTLAALLLAGGLKTFAVIGLFGALREVRNVEIVSYTLILLIGLWRLWAGVSGHLHEHAADHEHACDDDHHHDHHHQHPAQRTLAGWLLLTAAGIAPCAGALVVILLSLALGVLWAGIIGVIAIALGMAITLAAVGMASMVAHRLIIGDGRSREIGRFTAIAASLIVIATAGTLLLGALERFIG